MRRSASCRHSRAIFVTVGALDTTTLQAVSLAAAEERSVEGCFKSLVAGLSAHAGVALARIWLIAPLDTCEICARRGEKPEPTLCLHLVASDGASLDQKEVWRRVDGAFHLFRLGQAKIGHIALAGGPVVLHREDTKDRAWPQRPEWIEREGVQSFIGQPLTHRGTVLGVIGVFCRRQVVPADDLARLSDFAARASVAFVNSRAFGELEASNQTLQRENDYLREEISTAVGSGLVGNSSALRTAMRQAELVASTSSTVLLSGESGSGKELFARFIHERSTRRERPLVKVNCGSIPRELFESEFFGHVKGAFTGATRDRLGRFQLADRGTLFLDEVGEIPLELQPNLLRALQEGEFERVGDDKTIKVDVRVLAATNRDLKQAVAAGTFREDLFYRLSVFPIAVPPLRDRRDDIPALARHFVERARRTVKRPSFELSERDLAALKQYPWPGNVRELANVIERAAILSADGAPVALETLLPSLAADPAAVSTTEGSIVPLKVWEAREKQNLLAAVERANWKLSGPGGAAELLGMKPTTLSSRLRALGIVRPRGRRASTQGLDR